MSTTKGKIVACRRWRYPILKESMLTGGGLFDSSDVM